MDTKAARLCWASAAALCAALGVLPSVGFAADATVGADTTSTTTASAESSAPTEVAETVVTARRVAEDIQKVPIAVSAFSEQKLASLVVEQSDDLNKLSAGLQSAPGQGQHIVFTPVIRGYGTSFGTGQNSVISYFAEVPNFQISFFDLQNIQVLEGPQSTLFGETAVGGAILFEPQKPKNQFGGYVDVQGGNYNYTAVEFAIGGPLVQDKLDWRLAGQVRKRNGYVTSIASYGGGGTTDLDNVDTSDWRLSVTWRPAENLENYLMVDWATNKFNSTNNPIWYFNPRGVPTTYRNAIPNNGAPLAGNANLASFLFYAGYTPPVGLTYTQLLQQAYQQQIAAGPFLAFNDTNRAQEADNTGFIDQTKWQLLPNLTIRNIFGMYWQRNKNWNAWDVDGTNLPVVDTNVPQYDPGVSRSPWTGGWPNRAWSDEVQVQGKVFDNKLSYQIGFYYRESAQREWQPSTGTIIVFAGVPYGGAQGVIGPTSGPAGGGLVSPSSTAACRGVNGPDNCTPLGRNHSIDYAVYGQGTWSITDAIHLTGGLRESWDYRNQQTTAGVGLTTPFDGFNFPLVAIDNPVVPGATVLTQAYPWTRHLTYTIAGDWQINDRTMVYVTNRTGYKSGGVNTNTPVGSPDALFGGEDIMDTELGVKTDIDVFGVHMRLDADVYTDNYTNVQETTLLTGTAQTITANTGDVKNSGFELTWNVKPAEWFEFAGFFTYIDAYYTKWDQPSSCKAEYERPQCDFNNFNLPPGTAGGLDFVDINHAAGLLTVYNGPTSASTVNSVTHFTPDTIPNVSKFRWSLQPIVHLKPLIGQDITVSANIYYKSLFATNPPNYSVWAGQNIYAGIQHGIFTSGTNAGIFIPSNTLVDLRIDWRHINGSNLSLAASVTNLMNKVYMDGYGNPIQICGCTGAVVGQPRMWFMEMKYDF